MRNEKMRKSRIRYGITLKDIANKTFVPEEMLREWEEGISVPRDKAAVMRVADMIKCDFEDIWQSN